MKKKLIILGCTGSIGTTAIELIRKMPDRFQIVGLSAHNNHAKLLELASEFQAAHTALTGSPECGADYCAEEGLVQMIRDIDADMVVHGITGASGLRYSVEALMHGKDLALANKESIVMAGELLFQLAETYGRVIVPVDSEHSAIFQLLRHRPRSIIRSVLLTASGGPFRNLNQDAFSRITPEEALNHPTWDMGKKISIDSATLANKGLEIIETAKLFSLDPDQISVVIHPQSIVHSMIETSEGSLYGQMSAPSMKLPILNAISYPEIIGTCYEPFSLAGKTLTFEEPDMIRFPMVPLAFEALKQGAAYPIAYNAANEAAVSAFLEGRISFPDISRLTEMVLQDSWDTGIDSFDAVYEADRLARTAAGRVMDRL